MARQRKSIPRVILSAFFSLLVFFIVVIGLNYAAAKTDLAIVRTIAEFLNQNLLLIVLMSLLCFVADLFRAMIFPLNLPAPIFSAVASVFLVEFIFRIFGLAEGMTGESLFDAFRPLILPVYIVVFFVVLIAGYISIFFEFFGFSYDQKRKEKAKKTGGAHGDRDWEDVGREFRNMMYDAFHEAREEMRKD